MASVSSYRLLLIIFTVNFLIGIAGEIYMNPTGYTSDNSFSTRQELYNTYEEEVHSDIGIWGTIKASAERLYDNTIGNAIKWGSVLIKIFLAGLNPFSFTAGDFTHELEKIIANVLVLARSGMMAFLILDAYFIFKNKKTN